MNTHQSGFESVERLLEQAITARIQWNADHFSDGPHITAFRLFNGFLEGFPDLVADIYACTLVLFLYGSEPESREYAEKASEFLRHLLPWLKAVVVKTRRASVEQERKGILTYGQAASQKVYEHDVWYAVDLMMNLDASLYLDTRLLRGWLKAHMAEKRVLNSFAYTGSLGVAAVAGGARQVVQLDLSRKYLNVAMDSYALNGFSVHREDFITGDFWTQINRLKSTGELFDCVLVDPPFFSQTNRGKVDLVTRSMRVINKVRPLVGHGGLLVVVNNALFLSGKEYLRQLEELCVGGYLSIEELIPVPSDFTGFPETRLGKQPSDPFPFNHATKIAVLRVKRKDGRSA